MALPQEATRATVAERARGTWQALVTVQTADPQQARQGRMFNAMALGIALIVIPLSTIEIALSLFVHDIPLSYMLPVNGLFLILCLGSYSAVRHGRMGAIYAFFIGTSLGCLAAAYTVGGGSGPLILSLSLPIMMAGLFLGARGALILASINSLLCILSAFAEIAGWISPPAILDRNTLLYLSAVVSIVLFYIIAFVVRLFTANIRDAFAESQRYAAAMETRSTTLQAATNATVMATEEGNKDADEGVLLAAQTGQAIEQLAAVIDESAQAATQMVAGGRQQATGIEQVALAMQSINQATAQSLASTRQAEQAARNLDGLARRLSDLVKVYEL